MAGAASRDNGKKGGRPKGSQSQATLTKAEAREALRTVVISHMDAMLSAQIKNAQGINYLVKRAKAGGKFEKVKADQLDAVLAGQDDDSLILEVWEERPNVQAFTDLMNRALDKPIEQIELSGNEDRPVAFKWQD